jgi:uncharacterized protein Veg
MNMLQSANALPKFSFSLKTRDGQNVDNIVISARDRETAEHRLRQMYIHCEITQCEEHRNDLDSESMSFEDILTLISK